RERDVTAKGRDEPHAQRSAEHREDDITEPAKARGAEACRGLIDRAIDLARARPRGLITHENVPEEKRDDDEKARIAEVEPALVEGEEVAQPEEDARNRG